MRGRASGLLCVGGGSGALLLEVRAVMPVIERARLYLAKCPPAISGQGGHDQTFSVATALAHGFCLDPGDVLRLMGEYNALCHPPWSEAELAHKVKSAVATPHQKPRGFLLGGGLGDHGAPSSPVPPRPAPAAGVAAAPARARAPIPTPAELPDPILDGARVLLRTCFAPGEGVRIVPARLNDDGREVPDGDGPTLSREEWLRKLDARAGDPNGIWRCNERTGIYVAVNPLRVGGSRDADVTDYRHALVEFDGLSQEEQWNLYLQTNLPCAVVVLSGGKSVHAWVKIEAKDRAEYDARVKVLFEHFAPYGLDAKNKNPSRLSRLPNCVRFNRRQELLAVNIGAASFLDWLADKDAAGLGQEITLAEMLAFDPAADADCILGRRWLSRGSACMWIGQSGVGKSALSVQAAIHWGLARAFFGVAPVRPLKSLIIQHENDLGDCSEMLQGVLSGMGVLTASTAGDVARELKRNLVIIRERTHTGANFLPVVRRLIDRHHPDLVWLDPLYTFLGADINNQKECSDFLCGGLGPITEASGACWMMMHHTGKPSADPKSRKGWTKTDYSYMGLGSSILTNWPRATCTLLKRGENLYELQFGKRGRRAGALDLLGQFTTSVWLEHSDAGIFWRQVAPPAPPDEPAGEGPRGRPPVSFDPQAFLADIRGEHLSYAQCLERVQAVAGCGERKAKDLFSDLRGRLAYDKHFRTYSLVESTP